MEFKGIDEDSDYWKEDDWYNGDNCDGELDTYTEHMIFNEFVKKENELYSNEKTN